MEMSSILSAFYNRTEMVKALPPHIQEEREIQAILNDSRLVELLGNEKITDIRKTQGENGPSYFLITDLGEIQVDVRYLPPKDHICGPAQFELFFHPLLTEHIQR